MREARNFRVRNRDSFGERVSKTAEARAEHDGHLRSQLGLPKNEFRGAVGEREAGRGGAPLFGSNAHFNMIPTIDADIKFAIVPAAMARIPSRARSVFLLGASAPMPPI